MFKKVLAVALTLTVAVGLTGCSAAASSSQKPAEKKKIEYPTKAVQVIHGFKPGGGSDQLSQLTQPFLEKVLGQKFVNTYKPGADGAIVWKEIAESKPDGYTLGTLMTPKTQLNAIVNPTAGYSMDQFVPIANMVFDAGIFVVPPDSKFKTMQEVLDYAKQNPGKLKVGNSGTGGNGWYNGMMIQKLSGTTWNNIPFEGDGPTATAVAGGHVEAATTNVAQVTGMVKGGKLRALAVYTDKRLESLPDVPTLKEIGIDFSTGSYRGYLAPKDTPKEVVEILADGLEKVANDPAFKKAADEVNISVYFMRGDTYQKFLDKEQENLKRIVEEQGLKAK
jgi:putative tricarboxylic transport membrane protein